MALLAYASLTINCTIAMACSYLFLWISFNKNVLNRDIKHFELQIALLLRRLEA